MVTINNGMIYKEARYNDEIEPGDFVIYTIENNIYYGFYKGTGNGTIQILSPYIINWEDDWRLLKVIPLDEILGYMEKNPKINQVVFNHNANETSKHEVIRPVLDCGTFKLTQIQEWAIGPGIWRTDFTKAKWPNHADAHYCLTAFGSINLREGRDMKWMAENVGNYFYGGHLEGPFVEHLGINSVWNAPIDGRGNG